MDKIYLVVVFGGDDIDSKNYGIVGDKYFLECIGAYLIKDIAIKRKNDFIKNMEKEICIMMIMCVL